MHLRSSDIADWLQARVVGAGARGLAVGLSGGLDSAVVAGLCRMAMPDQVVALMMPCHSDPADEADARLVAAHFGIPAVLLNLDSAYDRLTGDLQHAMRHLAAGRPAPQPADGTAADARLPLANLKPRLRMASIYFAANSLNYLVAGAANRCELTVGYFTKHGDGGVDLLPIGALLKSEVRALARDLGVPESIIEKTPSAGLWPGQSDEEDMGFTYEHLERYLSQGPEAVAPALALRIERLMRASEHKRAPLPAP